jgi:phage-related protein
MLNLEADVPCGSGKTHTGSCKTCTAHRHHNFAMLRWKFETYCSASNRNDVQTTIDDYDDYSREAFSRAVSHLSVTPKSEWHEPHSKKLKNQDPIYEIRYTANNRATRALGFFEESRGIFVIVLVCFHKGRVYTPPSAFDSAQRRVAQICSGNAKSVPLQILGENFPADED